MTRNSGMLWFQRQNELQNGRFVVYFYCFFNSDNCYRAAARGIEGNSHLNLCDHLFSGSSWSLSILFLWIHTHIYTYSRILIIQTPIIWKYNYVERYISIYENTRTWTCSTLYSSCSVWYNNYCVLYDIMCVCFIISYSDFPYPNAFFNASLKWVWIIKVLLYIHTDKHTCIHLYGCKHKLTCTYMIYTCIYTYQAIIFLISVLTFIQYFFYCLFDTLQLLMQLTVLVLQNTSSEQHWNVIIIRVLIVKLPLSQDHLAFSSNMRAM